MCNEGLLRLFYATHSSKEMATDDVYEAVGHHSMSPRARGSCWLSRAPHVAVANLLFFRTYISPGGAIRRAPIGRDVSPYEGVWGTPRLFGPSALVGDTCAQLEKRLFFYRALRNCDVLSTIGH